MGIAVDPSHGLIATREIGTPSNYVWQVDEEVFEPLPAPQDYHGAKAIAFSDNGRTIVAVAQTRGGGMMKVAWDISTRPIAARVTPLYSAAEQSGLESEGKSNMLREAVIGAGARLLVEYMDGLYVLWDLESDAFLASFNIKERIVAPKPEFIGAGAQLQAGQVGKLTRLDFSQATLERHICSVVGDRPTEDELVRLFGVRTDLPLCRATSK
jgi:hypothetical protein